MYPERGLKVKYDSTDRSSISTGGVSAVRLEHKAGPDIIHELAVNLYPSSLESFREAIANSLDEGSKKVELQVSLKEVIMEDWGQGIRDIEQFRLFGQYAKTTRFDGEVIGMKGLGKLSLLRLGTTVNFRTNNGEYGIDVVMTPESLDATIGARDKFVPHQGTRVVIPTPKGIPPIEELSEYLRKVFGLRIAKGTEISLNGVLLKSKVDSTERLLFRLAGDVDVPGNLKRDDKKGRGAVDVYVKHVYVTSILVDPERSFTGWVNCNELIPTTSRTEIVKDEQYGDFLKHLKEHVASRFPKREEEIGHDEILLGNELANLLKNFLKDMNLYPEGKILVGKDGERSPTALGEKRKGEKSAEAKEPEKEVPEYVKIHMSRKTNKPIRRVAKTDYGIMWIDQDYGNEKEPLFFVEPNMAIRNRTNSLYRFALKSKPSLGPKWLRLLPYLSRLAVSVRKEYKSWSREQTALEIDRTTRYFLKSKGEL